LGVDIAMMITGQLHKSVKFNNYEKISYNSLPIGLYRP